MSLQDRFIEQYKAEEVLSSIINGFVQNPVSRAVKAVQAMDPDIALGKQKVAQAITAKGVSTQPTQALETMAANIKSIRQETIEIDGGEMYAKQLFGALETPCFWNLYDVLVSIISDNANSFSGSPYTALQGHQFGGIMLFEFPKGDATTSLSDFPLTGGGYIMSDGAAYYNEAPTHTWNDDLDGKGNRWIALLMATEGENFTIASAAVCPSSIYIGGKVGTITYGGTSAGKISEIVVPDGNELGDFIAGSYAQNICGNFVLRNIVNHTTGALLKKSANMYSAYINAQQLSGGTVFGGVHANLASFVIDCPQISGSCEILDYDDYVKLSFVHLNIANGTAYLMRYGALFPNLKTIIITGTETATIKGGCRAHGAVTKYVYVGYSKNGGQYTFTFANQNAIVWTAVEKLELQSGWCKNLIASELTGLTEDGSTNNITEYILKRLKQDEANCGQGVTITLGSTNLAKLTSDESVALLATLRNTYGYTFA